MREGTVSLGCRLRLAGRMRPFALRRRSARGFTLIEVLTVTLISVLLMTSGFMVYNACLKAYRESQGTSEVYQTAKFLITDMREAFSSVVPLKGEWVTTRTKGLPGIVDANNNQIDNYYLTSATTTNPQSKATLMTRNKVYDPYFSGPQYPPQDNALVGTANAYFNVRGYGRSNDTNVHESPDSWRNTSSTYPGTKGWWMPAFFGYRDGSTAAVREADDIMAGSWGWPRPDYRLDADADKLADNKASLASGGNVACWFYTESRFFKSPYTLALDNANIVLLSMKVTVKTVNNREEVKLSILRHQIVGFDIPSQGNVKGDSTYGDMLRAIKITPYFLSAAGILTPMGDTEIGWRLAGGEVAGGGTELPACFDVRFSLRNPGNMKRREFSTRIYQLSNPQ